MERQETVVKVVLAKLNIALKKAFDCLRNIQFSYADDETAVLSFSIIGTAEVTCTFRESNEMLIMRGEADPEGLSEDELDELGAEITEKINGRRTCYDGTLTIMKVISYKNMNDEKAQRTLYGEVMAFVQTLVSFQSRLRGNHMEQESENFASAEFAQYGEDDPFGFDDIEVNDSVPLFEKEEEAEVDEESENKMKAEDAESQEDTPTVQASKEPDGTQEKQKPEKEDAISAEDVPEPPHEKQVPKPTSDSTCIQAGKPEDGAASMLEKVLHDLENDSTDLDVFKMQDMTEMDFPDSTDVLKSIDVFQGDDKYGLIQKVRDYKQNANAVLDKIHDLLADLYLPIYQSSVLLYERDSQLDAKEHEVQQALSTAEERQREVDENQSELMEQQKAVIEKEAAMHAYRESVQKTLEDYKEKCRIVQEQDERILELTEELAKAQEAAALATRKLDVIVSGEKDGTISREYVALLHGSIKTLTGQVQQMADRVSKYKEAANLFREYQTRWEQEKQDYEKRIHELSENTTISDSVRQEVEEAHNKAAMLERENLEISRKLEDSERRLKEIQTALVESQKKTQDALAAAAKADSDQKDLETELRQRAEAAEAELAEEREKYSARYDFETVIDTFAGLGINLEPVIGESEAMFGASFKGCEIAVDTQNTIVFLRKPVRKTAKYVRQVDDLNRRDIMTVYALSDRDVTCRFFYTDVNQIGSRIEEILATLESIN